MRGILLVSAAAVAAAVWSVPASAQSSGAGVSNSGGSFDRGRHRSGDIMVPLSSNFDRRDRRDRRDFGDFDDRRDRRGSGGDTYFPYRDYQGDSLWRHDSFNDWWHERPHRAYPAWVSRNKNCERLWWSGGDWRC